MAWQAFVLIAPFCSVMVSAILIMLSRFFDFKPLEQSAKAEIMFALSSLAIVPGLFVSHVGHELAEVLPEGEV